MTTCWGLLVLLEEDVVDHVAHVVAAVGAGAGGEDLEQRAVDLPARVRQCIAHWSASTRGTPTQTSSSHLHGRSFFQTPRAMVNTSTHNDVSRASSTFC